MTEFSLSFMSFCEEDYERQYCEKIENFLRLIVPLTPAQSSSTASSTALSVTHNPAYLNCFSSNLQKKLISLRDDHSAPFVQVRRFEAYGVNIICSPEKHCRQRVRFAVFAIEDKAQFTVIGDEDKREKEPYHSLSQRVIGDIESKVAISRVSSQPSLYYCMWEGGTPSVIVQDFPIASEQVAFLMPIILSVSQSFSAIYLGLQAIHYLSSTTGDLLITLIYDRPLSQDWEVLAEQLQRTLTDVIPSYSSSNPSSSPLIRRISIIGRSKGQKIVYGEDYIIEELRLERLSSMSSSLSVLRYKQIDDGFSNPNTVVNMRVLDWLCVSLQELLSEERRKKDLLEMYCGNGNHTVALSRIFRQIFAVEINEKLVEVAKENFQLNDVSNVNILAAPSATVANRILGKPHYQYRPGRQRAAKIGKMEEEEVEVIEYDFGVVLVDPPRAGLDEVTIKAVQQYSTIIYISCYPPRLLENVLQLQESHEIVKIGIFDHFAYTPHLEVGVILMRRQLEKEIILAVLGEYCIDP